MSFVTPTDGLPAVAEHVAQLTETFKGNRAIPVVLTGTLTVQTKAVAVSGTAGNTVVWNTDGFYVPTPAAGLTLPLTQHLTFSPDNTYDIGAAAASRPRTVYAATSVQTLVVESPSGFQNLALKPTNNLQFYTSGTWRWGMDSSALYPAFDNTLDIGLSGFRPKKTWVRDFDSNGTSTFPDLGADTPSAKFNGMVGFGGRVNIGGVAGADRIGWMVTGINTPSTTLMPGTTQTLWYAEYWANDAATAAVNGMDFGVIGPPSVKVDAMSLMRLRGIGARTLGPNYARGLLVEQITNGTVDNIGVEIRAPGTTGSGRNLSLRSAGDVELQAKTRIGNANDAWFERDGPSGELRMYAQSQLRLSLGYGAAKIISSGHLHFVTDNTYDIGASSTTLRPRDLFLGRNLITGGNVGIGTAILPNVVAAFGVPASITDANPWGIYAPLTYPSTTTGTARGVYTNIGTAAAAFTMAAGYAFSAGSPVVGAGSAITTTYGLRVENQGAAGVTNAYGVYIANQSGASTLNYGLRNLGTTWLDKQVDIGNPVRGSIFSNEGTYPGLNLASFTGAIEISSAPPNPAQVTYNAWYDGTAWKRIGTDTAFTLQVTGSGMVMYSAPSAGAATPPAFAQMAAIDNAGSATFQGNVNIAGQFAGQGFTHGYVVCPYSGWVIDGWSKLVIVGTPGWWVYLPNGTSKAGYYVIVKNWSGGVITIAASGGQVIGMPGGTTPASIAINSGEAYTFMSDGGAGMMVISKAV